MPPLEGETMCLRFSFSSLYHRMHICCLPFLCIYIYKNASRCLLTPTDSGDHEPLARTLKAHRRHSHIRISEPRKHLHVRGLLMRRIRGGERRRCEREENDVVIGGR